MLVHTIRYICAELGYTYEKIQSQNKWELTSMNVIKINLAFWLQEHYKC